MFERLYLFKKMILAVKFRKKPEILPSTQAKTYLPVNAE
jgi:hypothetical protein